MSEQTTLSCSAVAVGDKLEALDIDITTGMIVGGALATRDFQSVHHDKAEAIAQGLPDVFMNILTSQGFMTRYATDWSGPEAVVKKVDLRLGAPNLPGMVMTMTGEVTNVDTDAGTVDIAVMGENNIWGMHMQGSVQLELPKGA